MISSLSAGMRLGSLTTIYRHFMQIIYWFSWRQWNCTAANKTFKFKKNSRQDEVGNSSPITSQTLSFPRKQIMFSLTLINCLQCYVWNVFHSQIEFQTRFLKLPRFQLPPAKTKWDGMLSYSRWNLNTRKNLSFSNRILLKIFNPFTMSFIKFPPDTYTIGWASKGGEKTRDGRKTSFVSWYQVYVTKMIREIGFWVWEMAEISYVSQGSSYIKFN